MTPTRRASSPTVAFSAPGKVLLAGGYLVLDRAYTGLVFGLSARINVVAGTIHTSPGVQITEIVVESPQFVDAQWRYGWHLADANGGITVTQLQVGSAMKPNAFVETTLNYALTYINRVGKYGSRHSMPAARLIILADNEYYSVSEASKLRGKRFSHFGTTLADAHKTGLGSSAALVTALTAALLSHYLPNFNLSTDEDKQTLHNIAQAAHCAAQGKIGSGFDVAAAVYGSCIYRRFSPSTLESLPEAGTPNFGPKLESLVQSAWDVEINKTNIALPDGLTLRMLDVDCGTQTVGMVKGVLKWRAENPNDAKRIWDGIHALSQRLALTLRDGPKKDLRPILHDLRGLIRVMSDVSDIPVEPESQTRLLDSLTAVEGVYGGVVPGAGGFDALAILVEDDAGTEARLREFGAEWSGRFPEEKTRLLKVRGEMEGVKQESMEIFEGWLS